MNNYDWRLISMLNDFRVRISLQQYQKILTGVSTITEARFNEYSARNPFTSIAKVRRDFIVGQICEQAAYEFLLPVVKMLGLTISEPDFEFHPDNCHGSDMMIDGHIKVSVKGIDSVYNDVRSWVYQPDKLPIGESLHLLMHVHQIDQGYKFESPPIVEWCYLLSNDIVRSLLKKPFKEIGGKMAIYENDIVVLSPK